VLTNRVRKHEAVAIKKGKALFGVGPFSSM